MQGGANPGIVLAARKQVPDNDGNFAGDGNGRHMGAAPCTNTFVESAERTGASDGCPCGLNQHRTGMARSLFGDAPMPGGAVSRLMHAGVQSKESNETCRAGDRKSTRLNSSH